MSLKRPCVYLATLSAASRVLCAQNLIRALALLLTIDFISDKLLPLRGNKA